MAAIKMSAPVGAGTGTQKFSIKPGGVGLQLDSAALPAVPGVIDVQPEPAAPPALPPEPVTPPTPFSRLYPGIDPSQVEMVFDDKTRRMRAVPIAPPEAPVETPAPPAPPAPPVPPPTPAAPDSVAELKAQLAEQTQLMTAMIQAQLTGRPLAEVLSGTPAAPAEPDLSGLDLYDDAQRAQFVKQVRADALNAARAEVQAQMRGVMPQVQSAGRHGEYFEIQAAHGAEPDFQQKAALANQLIGNNPNVSFKATYELISQIQRGLTPTNGAAPEPTKPPALGVLTKEQADAKAAQAEKYRATNGARAVGKPEPPPEVARDFKRLAKWVAHQQAMGNID
jgi:hypothetical protein